MHVLSNRNHILAYVLEMPKYNILKEILKHKIEIKIHVISKKNFVSLCRHRHTLVGKNENFDREKFP